jgi:hypothetical protein
MAAISGKTITAATYIGNAGSDTVSRWRVHVTAITGTTTVKARIIGTSSTPADLTAVSAVGSTTMASTIAATGLYDIDAAGLEIQFSGMTSMTFDAHPVAG